MTMSNLVEFSIADSVAVLALNRPEVRNAINDAMRGELLAAVERAAADDAITALVLTGNGKSFSSGGDISGMRERLKAPQGKVAFNGWRRQGRIHRVVGALHGFPKPTIAAVNGAAAGVGCSLALLGDLIVAAESAYFLQAFRRIGLPRAKELIFTGRSVGAKEALAIGLADRVSANLVTDAVAWARELGSGSPASIALAKSILDRTFESTEEQVFALGREAQAICYTTEEHRASVEAFLNKTGR